jgi:UDP-2,3-diacylglucosamine hydrolase
VRQAAWQSHFLSAPLAARLQQARQMREASQAHQQAGTAQEGHADVDPAAAEAWMQAAGCDLLIHGHTHRPASEPFGFGTRHVLSDWDLDHGSNRAEVLRWQPDGFTRIQLR